MKRTILLLAIPAFLLLISQMSEAQWKIPNAAPLLTKWAKEVVPAKPLPEYPRPQLVREDWLNLNGLWEFAQCKAGEDPPIVKTEIIGTGVMLFEADILNGMEKPWFADHYMPGTNSVNKMQDVAFVERLNNSGSQVWCDTQIIVKHLGVLEIDDSFMWRFE